MVAAVKATRWKILVAVFVAVFVDVLLHRVFAPRIEYDFPPSILVEKGLFLPAACVALIILFGIVAIVFTQIQDSMPGTKAAWDKPVEDRAAATPALSAGISSSFSTVPSRREMTRRMEPSGWGRNSVFRAQSPRFIP